MTQQEAILNHLQSGKTLTSLEALEKFGCLRLAARISDLREDGHQVASVRVTIPKTGKQGAQYSLVQEFKKAS